MILVSVYEAVYLLNLGLLDYSEWESNSQSLDFLTPIVVSQVINTGFKSNRALKPTKCEDYIAELITLYYMRRVEHDVTIYQPLKVVIIFDHTEKSR